MSFRANHLWPRQADRAAADAFTAACASGDLELVQKHISESCSVSTVRDSQGRTPLFAAASAGHSSCVDALLQQNAKTSLTVAGITPLEAAAAAGHRSCVQLLLAFGIDDSSDAAVDTLLSAALAQGGRVRPFQAHLLPASPEAWGDWEPAEVPEISNPHLELACEQGDVQAIRILGSRGDVSSEVLQLCDLAVLQQLVAGVDGRPVSAQFAGRVLAVLAATHAAPGLSAQAQTSEHTQPDAELQALLQRLFQLGAGREQRSALHIAAASGTLQVLRAMLQHAPAEQLPVNGQDADGNTPLHLVAGPGREIKQKVTVLLQQGAVASIKNSSGQTALAATVGRLAVVSGEAAHSALNAFLTVQHSSGVLTAGELLDAACEVAGVPCDSPDTATSPQTCRTLVRKLYRAAAQQAQRTGDGSLRAMQKHVLEEVSTLQIGESGPAALRALVAAGLTQLEADRHAALQQQQQLDERQQQLDGREQELQEWLAADSEPDEPRQKRQRQ